MKTWFISSASAGLGALIAQRALANDGNAVATAHNPQAVTERLGRHSRWLPPAPDIAERAVNDALAQVARLQVA